MTGNLRHINKVMEQQNISKNEVKRERVEELPLVHESCKYSTFTITAAIAGALVFAGIILYALLV